ncbi:hypothetical protein [Aeromonas veronii]|uniref:hypothetical protein n=1 Tax=Aeromonas veronii TaxID=654 RepID=UPI002245DB85|nr:hypothetical protein [Aeromonas veronii]MCX0435267.1 hypothetical protein [Aeromonas veronii]
MIYFAWAPDSHTETLYGPPKARTAFMEQSRGLAMAVTRPFARQMGAGLDERAFNELVAVLNWGEE